MVSSATVVAATRSASDSNLRCRERKWFRLLRPWRQRYSASDTNFRCRREKWFRLQNATSQRLQRFLISGGQFENRCKECPGLAFLRAAILDFKPRLENRCSQKVKTVEIPAAQGLEHCAAAGECRMSRIGRGNPQHQAQKKESRLIAESGLSKRGSYLLSHLV